MLASNRKLGSSGALALAMASVLSASACGGGSDGPPPDPAGTMTTNINYTVNAAPIELYYGLAEDGPYVEGSVTYPYVSINFGMIASLNFYFHKGQSQAVGTYANPTWEGLGAGGGEVADVGPVAGLGAVTEKPGLGYSSATAVQPGHGYVARFQRTAYFPNPALDYVYVRIYVEEYLTSSSVLTNGGVIGAKLRYQTPF